MAQLSKKLYVSYGGTTQTANLYSDTTGMSAYSYIIVDGRQAYIPLVPVGDSKATKIHVKESNGKEWCVASYVQTIPAYTSIATPNRGTTFTIPAGVSRVRVTRADVKDTGALANTPNPIVIAVTAGKTYKTYGIGGQPYPVWIEVSKVEYGAGIEELAIQSNDLKAGCLEAA